MRFKSPPALKATFQHPCTFTSLANLRQGAACPSVTSTRNKLGKKRLEQAAQRLAGFFWCRGMPISLSVGDDNEIQFAGQHVLRPEQYSHLDTEMKMFIMSVIML